ncbi:hypothetical protein K439DRAFT_1514853 [Ramaria rubella]|nr:hypothetical protein K439DRAFT_1514853 [Ramaria rubella]
MCSQEKACACGIGVQLIWHRREWVVQRRHEGGILVGYGTVHGVQCGEVWASGGTDSIGRHPATMDGVACLPSPYEAVQWLQPVLELGEVGQGSNDSLEAAGHAMLFPHLRTLLRAPTRGDTRDFVHILRNVAMG